MIRRIDGPTPNGNAYSEAYFTNDAGDLVGESDATNVEIVEFDLSGNVVFRTYMRAVQSGVNNAGINRDQGR